jgi:hypothetical protein
MRLLSITSYDRLPTELDMENHILGSFGWPCRLGSEPRHALRTGSGKTLALGFMFEQAGAMCAE